MDFLYFFGLFAFLVLLPLWLILKAGDFIERNFPSLWARMGRQPDRRPPWRRSAGDRKGGQGGMWGGGDGGGFGGGDGGAGGA